jgi:alkylation response protein AidB-like acyl-CoA dehydrogenase
MLYIKEQKKILTMILPGADEYHSLLGTIGDFFEQEILPSAKKVDQEGIFPRQNLEQLQKKRIMALPFPEEYNGSGLPFPVYIAAMEMLARACANTALQVSVQGMVCEGIRLFGDDRQKKEYLREKGLVEGKRLIAFALTEPCCGSDAKSIQTKAVLSGDSYVLNGSKILITNAGEADFTLVFAKTGNGISSFVVPGETPGFTVMRVIPKLGFRGNSLSAIHLKDCRVSRENLLGKEGQGLDQAKHLLNSGRLTIAAIAVGIAQAAYERALSYSKQRKAFGESISHFQLVQEKLADMVTGIHASRLLVYHAAELKDKGEDIASEAAQAKLFASETSVRICDEAIQIHGGYGYIDEYDVHRYWRDARMLTIGEGTSDMLRLLIAHLAIKEV